MKLDVMMIPCPTVPATPEQVNRLLQFAWQGKTIVLMMDMSDVTPAAIELLYALAPNFSFNIGSQNIVLQSLSPSERASLANRLRGVGRESGASVRLKSSDPNMEVRHISIEHGLSKVSSNWGSPLVQTDPSLIDVAVGCAATQSTVFSDGIMTAINAVDGNPLSCTHTVGNDKNAWLEVDLGRDVPVDTIVLLNRATGWQFRLRDLTVTLSLSSRGVVFESDVLNPDNVLNDPTELVLPVGGTRARYVRIRRTACSDEDMAEDDRNVLSLAQVQVLTRPDEEENFPLYDANLLRNTGGHKNENQWLEFDLQRPVDVKVVGVLNRVNGMKLEGGMTDLKGLTVSLSLDGRNFVFSAPVQDPGLEQGNVWVGGVQARYVRITRSSGSSVNLMRSQVQVWAAASNAGDVPARSEIDIMRSGPIKAGKNYCKKRLRKQAGQKRAGGEAEEKAPAAGGLIEGRLVVMMQDGMWKNGMMNAACDKRPHADGDYSHRLQYSLIDWLKPNAHLPSSTDSKM